ncbi:hypothetical protein Ancab_029182 [Ancistrocladus abbreviatus]
MEKRRIVVVDYWMEEGPIKVGFGGEIARKTLGLGIMWNFRCSYAEANIKNDFGSTTIDVTADIKPKRFVVLGGGGFISSAICKAAMSKGDVFYVNWDEVLHGATTVVSTLGGFGNEEQMKRINGEANVVSVTAAKDHGK